MMWFQLLHKRSGRYRKDPRRFPDPCFAHKGKCFHYEDRWDDQTKKMVRTQCSNPVDQFRQNGYLCADHQTWIIQPQILADSGKSDGELVAELDARTILRTKGDPNVLHLSNIPACRRIWNQRARRPKDQTPRLISEIVDTALGTH